MRNSRNFSMPPISQNVNNNTADRHPINVLGAFTEPSFQKSGALYLENPEESQIDKFARKKHSDVDDNFRSKDKEN